MMYGSISYVKIKGFRIIRRKQKEQYWLYKQLGMSYQNFDNMVKGRTKSIQYQNIETICLLLNCTPNDLFEFIEDLPGDSERKNTK